MVAVDLDLGVMGHVNRDDAAVRFSDMKATTASRSSKWTGSFMAWVP